MQEIDFELRYFKLTRTDIVLYVVETKTKMLTQSMY